MADDKRGFESPEMDENRLREIASEGGRVAHEKVSAQEWDQEAQEAGRKRGGR